MNLLIIRLCLIVQASTKKSTRKNASPVETELYSASMKIQRGSRSEIPK